MTAVLVLYLGEVLVYADDVSLLGPSTAGHGALEGKQKYQFQVKLTLTFHIGGDYNGLQSYTNTQHIIEAV